MDNSAEAKAQKRQNSKKRIKRKLLPSILAGFSMPITLFLYGPFDLFAQNRAHFSFSLYDFLLPCILITLICGAVLSVIPLFLRKKAYALYTAILFWASVMFYVQGSYLNFGYSSLAGDGVSEGAPLWLVIADAAIWAVTLPAVIFCVLKFKPVRKKLKTVVAMGLALVIFMEAVGFAVVSFEDGVYHTKDQVLNSENQSMATKMLTTKNLTTLSESNNVVVFLVDRFDATYYRQALTKDPQLFSELEGFTYYSDHTSMYPRTFPSTVYMLTGVEKQAEQKRSEYFKHAYSTSEYLRYLSDKGYGVNIYSSDYYTYDNAAHMDDFAQNTTLYNNYEIINKPKLAMSMIGFSLCRYFPFFLKGTVDHISTDTFTRLVRFEGGDEYDKYTTDSKTVYEQLTAEDFTLSADTGRFTFLHIDGCHAPTPYDENFGVLEEESFDIMSMMTQSFKIINRYISEMKRLGVYDDATIIITGDHAAAISDSKPVSDARITTLLIKPSYVSEGGTVTSNAPTCQEDLWKTIFASEGLTDHPECSGFDILSMDEDTQRERRYIFHRLDGDVTEEIVYKITGNANSFSNWQIVSQTEIPRIYN